MKEKELNEAELEQVSGGGLTPVGDHDGSRSTDSDVSSGGIRVTFHSLSSSVETSPEGREGEARPRR